MKLQIAIQTAKVEDFNLPIGDDSVLELNLPDEKWVGEFKKFLNQLEKGDPLPGNGQLDGQSTVQVPNPISFLRMIFGPQIDGKVTWSIKVTD